jgi:AcrR family transcriptional regulator
VQPIPDVDGERLRRGSEYLDAALELLDEFGTAEPTLGLTTRAAALAAGTTRSTMYRHWHSVGELNDDAARFAICHEPGWELLVAAEPFDRPLADVLGAALGGERVLLTSATRAAVAGWPLASIARQEIAEWEAATVTTLAAWLEGNAERAGRTFREGTSPRLAALTIGAHIEGVLLMGIYQHGVASADWPAGWIDDASRSAERILEHLTEPAPAGSDGARAAAPVPAMPAPPALTEAQRSILARMRDTLQEAPIGLPSSIAPGRVVDMARLARRCEVSERQLYRIWPTPELLNADICLAYAARYRRQAESYAEEVFSIGFSDQFATFDQLLVSALDAWVRSPARAAPATPFMPALPLLDPAVRLPVMSAIPDWSTLTRTTFVAILAMARWYRRPEVSADQFAEAMMDGVIGAQRLAALNPELLAETTAFRGTEQSVLGLVLYHLGRSMATTEPPSVLPPPGSPGAPPLGSVA